MPVKAIFGLFSTFFTEGKVAFTHTFFHFFTGSQKFSRTLFLIFSRVCFLFTREGNEQFSIIFTHGFFFFTGAKIDNIQCGIFQIQNLQHFGRLKISGSDYDRRL